MDYCRQQYHKSIDYVMASFTLNESGYYIYNIGLNATLHTNTDNAIMIGRFTLLTPTENDVNNQVLPLTQYLSQSIIINGLKYFDAESKFRCTINSNVEIHADGVILKIYKLF